MPAPGCARDFRRRWAISHFGGVLVARVLGDWRAIAEADWQMLNRARISHLVSISGLHITMISGLVALLVGASWRHVPAALAPAQTAASVAAVIAALPYGLLAGRGVPAPRTFFMLATIAVALWLRLATRPATALPMAAAVVSACSVHGRSSLRVSGCRSARWRRSCSSVPAAAQ